ncbi:MAG: T9SS type A sorting domain-containing protein [Bacteroidetes bacterium]|nr:T9SS type A sorting domain-containing protein [Bacteroidota bacterium]
MYPNPTKDFLKLKLENYKSENLTYHLYQLDGKIIETKKIENLDVTISMEHLASGIYFLKITELNKDIKTFKIIKN